VRAGVVDAVGIDHCYRLGQRDLGLVMVDHDGVEAGPARLGQRLVGCDAAVDGHDHRCALFLEALQRRGVGAIAFLAPVGNVDADIAANRPEETQQQRRGCGAVDVVVAEYHDALAALHRTH
jgi:hypothetical protein